jgi:hypothetical protein
MDPDPGSGSGSGSGLSGSGVSGSGSGSGLSGSGSSSGLSGSGSGLSGSGSGLSGSGSGSGYRPYESSAFCFNVTIFGDDIVEGVEYINVNFVPMDDQVIFIGPSEAQVHIVDNDGELYTKYSVTRTCSAVLTIQVLTTLGRQIILSLSIV